MEQEREAFEAWCIDSAGPLKLNRRSLAIGADGLYESLLIECYWLSWQARAAIAAQQAAPGWVLVPKEPTPEMRNAYHAVTDDERLQHGAAGSAYRAMLAAAPSAQQPPQE